MRLLHFVLNLKNVSHILQFVPDMKSDTWKIQWCLAYVTFLESRRVLVNVLPGVRTWQTVSKLSFIFLKIQKLQNILLSSPSARLQYSVFLKILTITNIYPTVQWMRPFLSSRWSHSDCWPLRWSERVELYRLSTMYTGYLHSPVNEHVYIYMPSYLICLYFRIWVSSIK